VTTSDPRAAVREAALTDLREWAESQPTARQRLVAAAWRAGVRNVAELARAAGVSRDTVYDDLRRENIDHTKRSAMPTLVKLSRRALVREHLNRIIAAGPLHAHRDHHVPDRAVFDRQHQHLDILTRLYGAEEIAAAYMSWLDTELAEQVKTATGFTSWNEIPMSTAPLPRWNRDRHGFLCVGCGDSFWMILPLGSSGIERWCKKCARDLEGLNPTEVWEPRLPAIGGHIAFPGLMPDEPHDNVLQVTWNGKPEMHDYVAGEASAFLAGDGWMGMTADEGRRLYGEIATPSLDTSGTANVDGREIMWTATFAYDLTPQGWRKSPYGFRLVTGTISSTAGVSTFDDAFDMLDAIATGGPGQGEQ
jgi:hypothetical protein